MRKEEKKYYTSTGFAMIFDDVFYEQGIINKKINNDQISVMHSFLKINTPVKIINPTNSKFIITKISKNLPVSSSNWCNLGNFFKCWNTIDKS